jgi:hypothetical protein
MSRELAHGTRWLPFDSPTRTGIKRNINDS